MSPANSNIRVITDQSYRSVQVEQLAKNLENKADKNLIITIGLDVVSQAISRKQSGDILISVGNPGKYYGKFDILVLPNHEPFPEHQNIISTTGLINKIEPSEIPGNRRVTVLLGGEHVGGGLGIEDAEILATKLNELDQELLITTSRRTSEDFIEGFQKHLTAENQFYNFNKDGQSNNPLERFIKQSDAIIVTADSARMMSEAASSGRAVSIYKPKNLHFSYSAMADKILEDRAARLLGHGDIFERTKTLNEAKRAAEEIIKIIER